MSERMACNDFSSLCSYFSLYSVGLVTNLPTENLNAAKSVFDSIPNKKDKNHISVDQANAVMDMGVLSPASAAIVNDTIDRGKDGQVSFGEIAMLIRGG